MLFGTLAVVAIAAIWILFVPHRLNDTDRYGNITDTSENSMLGAMDNALFGAFMTPSNLSQSGTWQTYQDGPMTIRYRTTGNGFNTVFTNNNTDYMMYGYGYGQPDMIGGAFFMLLFWAFIIVGAVLIVRYFMRSSTCDICGHSPHHHHHGGSSALDILAERYARGEIEKDEYETKKKDLSA